jgi:hypothetical protein
MSLFDHIPSVSSIAAGINTTSFTNLKGTQIDQVFLGSRLTDTVGANNTLCLDWWALFKNFPYLKPIAEAHSTATTIAGFGAGIAVGGTGGVKDFTVGDKVLLHYYGDFVQVHRSKNSLHFRADPNDPKSLLVLGLCAAILAAIAAVSITIETLYEEFKKNEHAKTKIMVYKVFPIVVSTLLTALNYTEKYLAGVEETVVLIQSVKDKLISAKDYAVLLKDTVANGLSNLGPWILEKFPKKQAEDMENCIELTDLSTKPA